MDASSVRGRRTVRRMPKTEVIELTESHYAEWDQLVDSSPQGTVFHKSSWLITSGKLLNLELKILGCFQDDRLIAGCSFFTHTLLGSISVASSLCRMTPYGGILVRQLGSSSMKQQESSCREIVKSICQSIAAYDFDHIRLVNSPALTDVRPFIWEGWRSSVFYAYYLHTDVNFETHVEPKVLLHMRRAARCGIVTKKSNDLLTYYKLYAMTYHRQNLKPPVAQSFFEHIFNLLKTQSWGEMWVAETASGEIASAEILVWDNKRAYAWSAASHTEHRKTGATSALLYREFQDLKNRDVKEYDLMSANIPHLASFNSDFNPTLVPYYQVEKSTFKFDIAMRTMTATKRLLGRN
jgi:hypothetical protein